MLTRRLLLLLPFAATCKSLTAAGRDRGSEARAERQLHEATNQVRTRHKLPPLAWNEEAAQVARSHSRAMHERGFFAHVDPKLGNPGERLKNAGVPWRTVGENIYSQKGHSRPVRRAVEGWMNSPGHRRNILGEQFTQTGIGAFTSRDGATYYTQIFLTPA